MRITNRVKSYGLALVFGLTMAFSAAAQNPYLQANNTWISISGTDNAIPTANTFVLNYGDWTITVEMDDWNNDADAFKLMKGDKVPVVVNTVGLQGTVSEVSGRKFMLNTGARKITVNTIDMPYNPMDGEGFQKIRKGDRVSMVGVMKTDLFNDRELHASSIVTLLDKNRN